MMILYNEKSHPEALLSIESDTTDSKFVKRNQGCNYPLRDLLNNIIALITFHILSLTRTV